MPTGDYGYVQDGELFVQGRLDSIIFRNGNKVDLKWVEHLVKVALDTDQAQVTFEKNAGGVPEIICVLPAHFEKSQLNSFDKIKSVLPSYALPQRFSYV